jgi:hypothetical protein
MPKKHSMLKKITKNLTKVGIKRVIEHKSADQGRFWSTARRVDKRLEETEKKNK